MFSGNNVPETNLAPAILYCLVAKKCEEYFPIIVWPYCILLRSRNFFTKHVIRLKIREGFGVSRFHTIIHLLNSFLFFTKVFFAPWYLELKFVSNFFSGKNSKIVFCCIAAWIQPDIFGCQQDFVWRWNQLRTF